MHSTGGSLQSLLASLSQDRLRSGHLLNMLQALLVMSCKTTSGACGCARGLKVLYLGFVGAKFDEANALELARLPVCGQPDLCHLSTPPKGLCQGTAHILLSKTPVKTLDKNGRPTIILATWSMHPWLISDVGPKVVEAVGTITSAEARDLCMCIWALTGPGFQHFGRIKMFFFMLPLGLAGDCARETASECRQGVSSSYQCNVRRLERHRVQALHTAMLRAAVDQGIFTAGMVRKNRTGRMRCCSLGRSKGVMAPTALPKEMESAFMSPGRPPGKVHGPRGAGQLLPGAYDQRVCSLTLCVGCTLMFRTRKGPTVPLYTGLQL